MEYWYKVPQKLRINLRGFREELIEEDKILVKIGQDKKQHKFKEMEVFWEWRREFKGYSLENSKSQLNHES